MLSRISFHVLYGRGALHHLCSKIQENVDSRLVANQVNGTYVAKEADMIRYLETVKVLTGIFKAFSIKQIPRSENRKADALSKIASTSFAYLRTLSVDVKKARAIKQKSWRFVVVNETLYKKSFLGPWLRCVGPLRANYVLREIHERSCSMHTCTRSVVAKALRTGYCWPTMHKDARTLIRACQDCQDHKPVPRNPQQKLTPITSPWTFYKWGIDIVRPFLKGPRKVKFLIVAMDYFTKWIEAKPVATITGSQIKKFVWDNVFCRFGLSREIISDNGKQFQDDPFRDWCEKLCIRQHFASVKHLKTNGLVERANRSLGEGIKARLDPRSKNWIEELPHVLWAHRTMIKSSNRCTLFLLTYIMELAEIRMPTLRTAKVDLQYVKPKVKKKMEKYYNSKVRNTSFKPGDLVYASRVEDTGKLGPKCEGPYEVTEVLGKGAYKLRGRDGKQLPRTWNISNLKKCHIHKINLEYRDEVKIAELMENFNDMSIETRKKEKLLQEEQWAYLSTHPSKCLTSFYFDDDDDDEDYTSTITHDELVLSTEETDNSLSMGDEHLDTIPAIELDEFIKSGVETLIPIPSESEGIPEHVCDVPFHDNSPPLDVLNDQIKDFSEGDGDCYPGALNANPTPSSDCKTKSSSTSLNSLLEATNTFDNSLPEFETFCFDVEEISSGSTTTLPDLSLPEYEVFHDDHVKEISSGSPTTHSDSSLYASFIFDLSSNPFPPADRSDFYEFSDELIPFISAPKYDCFLSKVEPNSRDFTKDVVEDISPTKEPQVLNTLPTHPTFQLNMKFQPSSESFFAYVVWIFLPFLVYSVVLHYLLSLRNEDIIFDLGICKSTFSRPDISHRCGTVKKFNTHRSHLNKCPMMIHG
nr:reverse transcriptase domain-containing protein [Tanacetum cinerariifolium]